MSEDNEKKALKSRNAKSSGAREELGDIHTLDDGELIAIGLFLQNWLRLEGSIDRAFGRVFDLDAYKRQCITSNMPISAKINSLRAGVNLVENHHQKNINAELNSLLDQTDKLNRLRNKLAHNWISGQIGIEEARILSRTSARGKLKREFELIDFKQVRKAAEKCSEVAEKLSRAVGTYALTYDRFELEDISMLQSTKYDPEFLDKSFHQILQGKTSIET